MTFIGDLLTLEIRDGSEKDAVVLRCHPYAGITRIRFEGFAAIGLSARLNHSSPGHPLDGPSIGRLAAAVNAARHNVAVNAARRNAAINAARHNAAVNAARHNAAVNAARHNVAVNAARHDVAVNAGAT